ncbi:hypothetical protein FA13DRAFT_1834691 [Coprinellus micaceus]|uniref:C2H2-type domain-containing protein n=1 Tax=Coprinellus micaceus TaxID=71717 RepID=A0A4Y7SH80_COPMI|nr:hypothetical protein FA13DRAFT_1834691 [Coprinellus micaceus]
MYPGCKKVCRNAKGLKQHTNAIHPVLSSDESDNEAQASNSAKEVHPFLNGVPVDADGVPLPPQARPPPWGELDPSNPWTPFEDRLGFEFAYHHYADAQSSAAKINKGLDFWVAAQIQALKSADVEGAPWDSAEAVYKTIDEIQQGNAPFTTVKIRYSGPLPENPPAWMTQEYELCVRDTHQVLHHQLATADFASDFDPAPYRQYQPNGERIWSNLMSAEWAWRKADEISKTIPGSRGVMVVPFVTGLDKTTVTVATGHQEYHPFYFSPGNISNVARRGHGNGVIPVAFLPIAKVSKDDQKKKEFKRFARQMYHACIQYIFEPLRPGMSEPEIVRCPDGHLRRAIYTIGPVIADYPEQVWLSGIVQGWCAKCMARPEYLDDPDAGRRTHELTDALTEARTPGILWDEYGIHEDIVPFTHSFPRADIHELMAPDLLHQVIKGTFKDHLVEWVMQYLHQEHGEARAVEIITDIDRRISAVPIFPGLRRFQDGRDFAQWTGDDSKALMKVYLAAIAGHVPDEMVQCLSSFLEMCYIFRRNAITISAIEKAQEHLTRFHELREIFVETGTRTHLSLPRQHALSHFIPSIIDFGSPNGLCSSITESRHITAVKEPWRRSNRYNALSQMLLTITRLDKINTLYRLLSLNGHLEGTVSYGMALLFHGIDGKGRATNSDLEGYDAELDDEESAENQELTPAVMLREIGPVPGPRLASSVKLCSTHDRQYPRGLPELAEYIGEPLLETAFLTYLFTSRYPNRDPPPNIADQMRFTAKIFVYHSAIARYFAPSDACGAGGMQRQTIRCNLSWRGKPRYDTVFVAQSDEPGMKGMMVGQVLLLFSFTDPHDLRTHSCALVNWFETVAEEPDPVTGMWVVEREEVDGVRPLQVIDLRAVVRGAHLLPVYGDGYLPGWVSYTNSLDSFKQYFVNPYVDHHAHELLSHR